MRGSGTLDLAPAGLTRARREVLARCEADPAIVFLELRGSLAADTADALSDLDARIGFTDAGFERAEHSMAALLTAVGSPSELLRTWDPELADVPNERWFVLFDTGLQLDLATVPQRAIGGRGPNTHVLYDPAGLGGPVITPPVLAGTAANVVEWIKLAWIALIDVWKYVERSALWEAHKQLEQTRDLALRIWAVARGLEYPGLGVTAVFDAPGAPAMPEGMERTVATLEAASLASAGLACARVLESAGEAALARFDLRPEHGFRAYVVPRLEQLAASAC